MATGDSALEALERERLHEAGRAGCQPGLCTACVCGQVAEQASACVCAALCGRTGTCEGCVSSSKHGPWEWLRLELRRKQKQMERASLV